MRTEGLPFEVRSHSSCGSCLQRVNVIYCNLPELCIYFSPHCIGIIARTSWRLTRYYRRAQHLPWELACVNNALEPRALALRERYEQQ
jgi:hypothetical protein